MLSIIHCRQTQAVDKRCVSFIIHCRQTQDVYKRQAVMYLGRLLEKAPSDQLFQNPAHPYTEALLSAIPIPSLHNRRPVSYTHLDVYKRQTIYRISAPV